MTARPNDQDSPRLFYVDDVKSFVIFLVVLLHASVTYSGLGGWYLIENKPSEIGMASLIVCGLFNSFTQAWFMGIMFFFGGYFARESLARRGPQSFVRDRILRLGIPLVFYVLAIQPSLVYAISSPVRRKVFSRFTPRGISARSRSFRVPARFGSPRFFSRFRSRSPSSSRFAAAREEPILRTFSPRSPRRRRDGFC